jgi:RNA polymerase subunit RPABC4/transcription elongation factor Spt4
MAERECPSCALHGPADETECPYCGYEFPEQKRSVVVVAFVLVVVMLGLIVFIF